MKFRKMSNIKKSYVTLLETLIAMSILSVLLVIVFGLFRELSLMSEATLQKQRQSFQMRYIETRLSNIFERITNERDKSRTFYFYTQPTNSEFSKSTSVIFTFDNGIRKDPYFSGDILARLYLSVAPHRDGNESSEPTYNLTLAMWPLLVEKPQDYMQEEVLLEGVLDVNFFFYAAPEHITAANAVSTTHLTGSSNSLAVNPNANPSIQNEKEADTAPLRDVWHENEWPITHRQMPSIIKMVVDIKTEASRLEKNKKTNSDNRQQIVFTFVLPSSKNPVHYPADMIP